MKPRTKLRALNCFIFGITLLLPLASLAVPQKRQGKDQSTPAPFQGNTLDEIYPEQKPLPALWWWNEKPLRASFSSSVTALFVGPACRLVGVGACPTAALATRRPERREWQSGFEITKENLQALRLPRRFPGRHRQYSDIRCGYAVAVCILH